MSSLGQIPFRCFLFFKCSKVFFEFVSKPDFELFLRFFSILARYALRLKSEPRANGLAGWMEELGDIRAKEKTMSAERVKLRAS